MAFDCDRFIIEIESRPAIWDSRCDEYANKCKKGKAWEEVCDMFVENFKAMDSVHKNKAAADLQRKWKNLRDCFRRELAKQRNCKSGSAADGRKQYIYFQQLTFLLPVCDTKPTTEESPDLHTQATPAAATSTAPTSLKRKKPSPETEELELLQSLRRNMEKRHAGREEEDSDRHFLLSLLPYFKRLPDDMKLEIQSDFLNTLRSISGDSGGISASLAGQPRSGRLAGPRRGAGGQWERCPRRGLARKMAPGAGGKTIACRSTGAPLAAKRGSSADGSPVDAGRADKSSFFLARAEEAGC
ncbi:uncharacterized protein LOC134535257 [Bacillus rossius redtenbacheri]|uniref:uncharacterized protein LOC134535257 n=1 Tax=Bacillus rossius redtenbacheri TaxID=93214 RepID=UPI002FDDA965